MVLLLDHPATQVQHTPIWCILSLHIHAPAEHTASQATHIKGVMHFHTLAPSSVCKVCLACLKQSVQHIWERALHKEGIALQHQLHFAIVAGTSLYKLPYLRW